MEMSNTEDQSNQNYGDSDLEIQSFSFEENPPHAADNQATEIIDDVLRKANILRRKISQSKAIIYAHGLKPLPLDKKYIGQIRKDGSSILYSDFEKYLKLPYETRGDYSDRLVFNSLAVSFLTVFVILFSGWTALFAALDQNREYYSENPWARNTLVIGGGVATTAISTCVGFLYANRTHTLKEQRSVSSLIREVFISETQLLELDYLIRQYESLESEHHDAT